MERARLQEEITKLRQENEELHRVHIISQAKVRQAGARIHFLFTFCWSIVPVSLIFCPPLRQNQQVSGPKRAIDLFSDILSLRAKVDKTFAAQERLPRVVVVGDQARRPSRGPSAARVN